MLTLVDRTRHFSSALAIRVKRSPVLSPSNGLYSFRQDGVARGVWATDYRPGWMDDPMKDLAFFSDGVEVSLPRVFGWVGMEESVSKILGDEPQGSEYRSSSDWSRYGNALNGIFHFGRATAIDPEFGREHDVYHSSWRGVAKSLYSGGSIPPRDRALVTRFGTMVGGYAPNHYNAVRVSTTPSTGRLSYKGVVTTQASSLGWYYSHLREFASDLSKAATDAGGTFWLPSGWGIPSNYGYASVQFTTRMVNAREILETLEYLLTVRGPGWQNAISTEFYSVKVSLRYRVVDRSVTQVVGVFTLPQPVVLESSWRYTLLRREFHNGWSVPSHYETVWPVDGRDTGVSISPFFDVMWDRSISGTTKGQNFAPVIFEVSTKRNRLEQLKMFVADHQSDLLRTSAYSSADALDKFASDSNFLESLTDVASMPQAFFVGLKALVGVRKLLSGDLSQLWNACQEIAGLYLTIKYGTVPTARDVAELSRVIALDLNTLLAGHQTIRGTFNYTFDRELTGKVGDGHVKLTTRSKVVINGFSALADTLLRLMSLGVEPSLANLWDLVPFSFVVDWFTGLSDRFSDIDSSMKLAAISPSYFVHSYEVSYVPSKSEMVRSRLSSDSDFTARVYVRHVSRYIPLPRDGQVDFRAPKNPFSKVLPGGALLVVLIR